MKHKGNSQPRIKLAAVTVLAFLAGCAPQTGPAGISPAEAATSAEPELRDLLNKLEDASTEKKKYEIGLFRLSFASSSAKQKAAYVLGRALLKGTGDDIKQAVPLFEDSSNIAGLWEKSQWHIWEAANMLGNEKLVRRALNEILKKSTVPETRAQASYGLAQSYLRASETDKAQQAFLDTQKEAPDSQFALGSNYYLGQMLLKDNPAEAAGLWRQYLKASPDGRFAQDIVLYMQQLPLQQSDHALFAEVHFAHGEWQKAMAQWDKAGDKRQWFKRAQCLLRSGKTAQAKETYMAGIKAFPGDQQVPEAARTLARLASKEGAVQVWHAVYEVAPKYQDAALYNLAIRAPEAQALQYYRQLVSRFPGSDYAPESRWWLVWENIKKGSYAAALPELKTGAAAYETARAGPRFSYWIGKVLEKQKQIEAAKAAYRQTMQRHGHHYYGWRAAGRLAALKGGADRGWATNPAGNLALYKKLDADGKDWDWPQPPRLVSYQAIERTCGATVSVLAQLRQWDECLEMTKPEQSPELRSLCLAKLNLPLEAINTMSKQLQGTPDADRRWQLSYPLLYSRTIYGECSAKRVDPLLAQALTREESRYDAQALSSSGAHGLMQLLPGTAWGVAKRLGVKLTSNQDIHKPEINIKLGVDYLSYALSRTGGNAMLAVAGYNGGPNAAVSWSKKYSLADPDYFVESIPFQETRDYVRKVFGSFWNYEAIYSKEAAS